MKNQLHSKVAEVWINNLIVPSGAAGWEIPVERRKKASIHYSPALGSHCSLSPTARPPLDSGEMLAPCTPAEETETL